MKHKVAIGISYSGFELSKAVEQYLLEKFNICTYFLCPRHDSRLIEAIESELAKGNNAHLYEYGKIKIVEIESNQYIINDYDGSESVITPDKLKWIDI